MSKLDRISSTRVGGVGALLALSVALAGCGTTSGSTRLDETGNRIADRTGYQADDAPENSAYYLQALKGGLLARMQGLKMSVNDRKRGLEAEYRALESAPGGQAVVWEGAGGLRGEVTAAVPYQVGSQNCRQYTHTVNAGGAIPTTARGAACRNSNGSWTPLS
jgi:surface antigen